jgi:hypothetical protein
MEGSPTEGAGDKDARLTSPAPWYILFEIVSTALLIDILLLDYVYGPPSLQTRVGGPFYVSTNSRTLPSLQTRAGGLFSFITQSELLVRLTN